ncbi:MAG TPA: hypothetical protein VGV39_15295 [Mesorhizobium sp.]|uniref:hypothetical protein n=1 Tax=Mesorhizobium sp. TaxID=1871066 RepID=UPI002DDDB329|nr:hypothetical protein [Mesorhizobium sp.]HEV2504443.1 hypothetical protein [Mesorhizobium sp.]
MSAFGHIFRWDRHGRKGQACSLLARSRRSQPYCGPELAFGSAEAKNFNSILVEFADGYRLVTSGNSIRRARP